MTLVQPPRVPGTLIAPPAYVACSCPPGLTHPDRSACYRHGKADAIARAVRALRTSGPAAALAVCETAARRPWWRRTQTPAALATGPTHPATPQHRRTA